MTTVPRTAGSALVDTEPHPRRAPYHAPMLEPLGRWTALTLQQSIPIGPGGFFSDLESNPGGSTFGSGWA
jgi:hypothetical protein